jgi:hypothetical protein
MQKVSHIVTKFKGFVSLLERNDVFVILLILFVGSGSFALGRLSVGETSKTPITIENVQFGASVGSQEGLNLSNNVESVNQGGEVVASKNGSKYHFPWCSGAQTMKEENKVWFASIADARSAGYEPAKNCKGLE